MPNDVLQVVLPRSVANATLKIEAPAYAGAPARAKLDIYVDDQGIRNLGWMLALDRRRWINLARTNGMEVPGLREPTLFPNASAHAMPGAWIDRDMYKTPSPSAQTLPATSRYLGQTPEKWDHHEFIWFLTSGTAAQINVQGIAPYLTLMMDDNETEVKAWLTPNGNVREYPFDERPMQPDTVQTVLLTSKFS